ncbi:hypothetical protein KJ855_02015 [Patescibacteria group bacterium]|nr:hypothetical protein [Patescibacteria group bacterium]
MSEFQPFEKICRVSGKKFTIFPEDQEFYAKKGVPLPTLSPIERGRRRFSFINNELALYRRKCDATGKDLITFYHPATPIKVYDREYWLSDEFDPFKYGRDYDSERSFFAQWRDLYWSVPTFHTAGINNVNGDYILYGHGNKDSFLVCGFDTENCMYGMFIGGRDSMDCAITYDGENMYECIACKNCYELFFGSFCQDCRQSRFLYDCIGCHDCIMCFGLRNKSYCIKNKQLSKEEYEALKEKYDLGSYKNLERLKHEYVEFLGNYPLRESNNVNCENCIGDFLRDASNCFMCFNGAGSRDCRYGIPYCNMETGCYDTDGTGAVNCYECNCYKSENVMFSKGVLNSHNVDYSIDIMGASHDLF